MTLGRGTIRIIETCKEAGLSEPELIERDGGFLVTLFKDRFSEKQLQQLGLNERQVDALLFFKKLSVWNMPNGIILQKELPALIYLIWLRKKY